MSAQAGIFYFDGRPIQPDVPRRLDAQLAEYGPDGSGHHVGPGLVMVHRALHVTPEDELERQPYVSERGNVMTWDGRLDNREDLLLQLWRDLRDDTTDVAIAMVAYEKWGKEGFGRLLGDWSLVVWDSTARRIQLASDYVGGRALYYQATPQFVQWSSTLRSFAGHTDDGLEPRFVVGYLTFAIPPSLTPYRSIEFAPPAHTVTFSTDHSKVTNAFWHLPISTTLRYQTHATYVDALRSLMTDAVAVRIRSQRGVWAELSGGLDSSTLVCLADAIVKTRFAGRSHLDTISYVSDAHPESDERPFISTIENSVGRAGVHLRLEDHLGSIDWSAGWLTPLHPKDVGLEILRVVRERGGRVLLSGAAGDLVMANRPDASLSAICKLTSATPLALIACLREWSRTTQQPIWQIAKALGVQLLPTRLLVERHARAILASHGCLIAKRIQAAAAQFFALRPHAVAIWAEEVRRRYRRSAAHRLSGHHELITGIEQLVEGRHLQSPSEFPGLYLTYPYAHRPLVEFMISIPPEVLYVPGAPRALMRDAMTTLLPPRILRRFSKGYAAPFITRSTKIMVGSLTDDVDRYYLVQAGYVDGAILRERLKSLQDNSCRQLANLALIVHFERWIQLRRGQRAELSAIPA